MATGTITFTDQKDADGKPEVGIKIEYDPVVEVEGKLSPAQGMCYRLAIEMYGDPNKKEEDTEEETEEKKE